MANKEVRTDMLTTATDPLAPARAPELSSSDRDASAKSAFGSLHDGGIGSYDQLSEGGKQAVRAFAALDPSDARYESAKAAAKDAIRDHRQAGLFSERDAMTPARIAESKDPAVRNQSPTGTQGESAGPQPALTAPSAPDANAKTPAVAANEPKKT